MIDRQKLDSILCLRFPGAPFHEIAAAANAIIGLAVDSGDGKRLLASPRDVNVEVGRLQCSPKTKPHQ